MKVWFYKAYGPYVGCEATGVVFAVDDQDACDQVYQIAADNYETYSRFEDEDDIEPEYDYYVEEYNPEKHDPKLYDSEIEAAKAFLEQHNPHQA